MATGIYTVIEFREQHIGSTKTDPVMVSRVVHVAAPSANEAALRWRAWAKVRPEFSGLASAHLCLSPVDVADCDGAKSEQMSIEQYIAWAKTVVLPHWEGSEMIPAAWRKLQ